MSKLKILLKKLVRYPKRLLSLLLLKLQRKPKKCRVERLSSSTTTRPMVVLNRSDTLWLSEESNLTTLTPPEASHQVLRTLAHGERLA